MTIPTLKQAFEFIEDMSRAKLNYDPEYLVWEDQEHCFAVGTNAALLAPKMGLDPHKAFILGLLHDYGEKFSAINPQLFHGLEGYKFFSNLGYDEVARICLTHSFCHYDFCPEEFTYPQLAMRECRRLIDKLQYNDYDRLIQFSDSLVNISQTVSLKQRIIFIMNKYHISKPVIRHKYKTVLKLKKWIDLQCGQDA